MASVKLLRVCSALMILSLLCGGSLPVDSAAFGQQSAVQSGDEAKIAAAMVELYNAKKFEAAFETGMRLLALREKLYGPDHVAVAHVLSDLGEIQIDRNRNDDAERFYSRGRAILEKLPRPNPHLFAQTLERLAHLKIGKRDHKAAANLLTQALAIRRTSSSDELTVATTEHALANLYQMMRRFDEAEPLYVKSLTTMEKKLGKQHPDIVATMKDYACLDYNAFNPRVINVDENQAKHVKPDPNAEIKYRARCWLLGFEASCATDVFKNTDSYQLLNGRALFLPRPAYPPSARHAGAEGRVIVGVLIDERGSVKKAKAVCGGHPYLRDAAVAAARGAKFSPTLVDSKPIEVTGVITYNFLRRHY